MDLSIAARVIHVLAVILWIGGVGFVTLALLPALRPLASSGEWLARFQAQENRFAWQSRLTTLLAGLSGLYMIVDYDLWDRFADAAYWWMHGMVLVWLIFSFVLFIGEPLFLDRWLRAHVERDPARAYRLVLRLHRLLLLLSLLVAAGAVAGSHGGL
jgi:uncharacterized membrane protein